MTLFTTVLNKYQEDLSNLSSMYRGKLLKSIKDSTLILEGGIEEFKFKSIRDWQKLEQCLTNETLSNLKIRREFEKYSKRQKKHFEKLVKVFDFYGFGYSIFSSRCKDLLKNQLSFDYQIFDRQDEFSIRCEKHGNHLNQAINEVSTNLINNHNSLFNDISNELKNIEEIENIFILYGKNQLTELEKLSQKLKSFSFE